MKRKSIRFARGDAALEGLLFLPANAAEPRPAVVVTGAWTTVKEQMAGTYARALAERGFAALVFDFAGWGASSGAPRHREDPTAKTADILAAVDALAEQPEVDAAQIYGLGVCASAGYMAAAAADHPRVRKLALVAPWLHDPAMAEQIYGGAESVQTLIAAGREAEQTPTTIIAASATDESALMFGAPYYTESDRGLIDAYDNRFDVASWEPWLTYDAQAVADRLTVPTLVVCSEAAALPAGAHAFVARTEAPVVEHWLDDVNQFDFYDRTDVVATAVDSIVEHLQRPQCPATSRLPIPSLDSSAQSMGRHGRSSRP
ncbi:MAG: alpha/beta fold hydrolase [Myxococcota bacterium]